MTIIVQVESFFYEKVTQGSEIEVIKNDNCKIWLLISVFYVKLGQISPSHCTPSAGSVHRKPWPLHFLSVITHILRIYFTLIVCGVKLHKTAGLQRSK